MPGHSKHASALIVEFGQPRHSPIRATASIPGDPKLCKIYEILLQAASVPAGPQLHKPYAKVGRIALVVDGPPVTGILCQTDKYYGINRHCAYLQHPRSSRAPGSRGQLSSEALQSWRRPLRRLGMAGCICNQMLVSTGKTWKQKMVSITSRGKEDILGSVMGSYTSFL